MPKENVIRICISIKPELNKRLEELSQSQYIPKSRIIALALEQYMQREGNK
jgi:metal-responsive CopG/Arc/MetJ family transcriptional regulator